MRRQFEVEVEGVHVQHGVCTVGREYSIQSMPSKGGVGVTGAVKILALPKRGGGV